MVASKQVVLVVRWFLCLIVLAAVTGCGTVKFTAPASVTNWEVKKPSVVTVKQETSPVPATTPATGVYRYGGFTVTQDEAGKWVSGGKFAPPVISLQGETQKHVLYIDYSTKKLSYYRRTLDGNYEPVLGYAVVTPQAEKLPNKEVRGRVRHIDLAPTWCPTQSARKLYPKLPLGCLPFGHPDNAMGDAKFEIVWRGVNKEVWSNIRLHGTSDYTRQDFWEVDTLGCTRLQNKAILDLVKELGPEAVKEGIEVVLLQGDSLLMTAQ